MVGKYAMLSYKPQLCLFSAASFSIRTYILPGVKESVAVSYGDRRAAEK